MPKLAILYDASQVVLSTFDLDEVLQQILVIARDYFHLPTAAILLWDPKAELFYVRRQVGWDADAEKLTFVLGQGLQGAAARQKRPLYVADVAQDPRYISTSARTRSQVAIPLMLRDQVVGVLDCQSDEPAHFDSDTLDLLTLFSTQASIALQNARLYSLERRRALQLEAINAITSQTTAVLDLDELLATVGRLILESFHNFDEVAVLLWEDDKLVVRAFEGKLTPNFARGAVLQPGMGLSWQALASRKTIVANDAPTMPGYVAGFQEAVSEICLPLISFGQTVGVLVLESGRAGAFEETDAQPLESVADIVATAIQNARYFDRVRQLAFLDGLTGIFNRRHFEQRISEELGRSDRYPSGWSMIMIDIDHFKKLNDEFGHLLGDEVLRQVSSLLAQQLRAPDVVCRYGGEEFGILLPETVGQGAMNVAEKLRRAVESFRFPGVPRPVTISAGVAEFPKNGKNRDELVKAADAALYVAKQGGRNRVFAASEVKKLFA
ncbi:MAG TPA: diguanylate cyclase [Terriglobales bacterium]|jgi:diguanylate cyclase (GGDEF)-like protein|nr:diguanylate cyclase [Terriglobales bacterium]